MEQLVGNENTKLYAKYSCLLCFQRTVAIKNPTTFLKLQEFHKQCFTKKFIETMQIYT